MSESKEQKINEILKNALKVLAKNGYENTTIANIATESGVSRGILHYYFSNKEDLVSKVLAYSSENIIQTTIKGIKGKTAEEIADNIIKDCIQSFKEYPDFYAFLFEMWCASRRSDKIKNELIICSAKVTESIEKVLDEAIQNGILKKSIKNTEEMSKVLLALFNGIAFEILMEPSRDLENLKYWIQVRNMILSILKSQ
ncbi:MAG TPA: TetR/AcrR family transcriptional regulator [Nitrososphaeraceae archaeon]|uniref:Putative HTH-type transcriptional regulator YfiR n=1 Tax=Candidatus Nitrosocosmicus oleophilus TaxID=1353260 RepID=A0A654LT38_9ARCH|nr:TetR/AcrR family transcriptional regulator [Candidatus Nitrosocosmicus oleophilus]ALI34554.1 putative HTH-type transcriptional regulator YfiR [Candidatus Nitrosocosmicus oleophilus]HVP82661.1 TetR/AcrR family transcriptional regulator [Nitrososphaeraceae archaeon]